MTATTTTTTNETPREAAQSSPQLDELVTLDKTALDQLYAKGATPTIAEIQGITRGKVLAGTPALGLHSTLIRQIANLGWLPWKGKAFTPIDQASGKGKNRMAIWPLEHQLFAFETAIIPPLVGSKKVFSLNYDLPGNPWLIRQIRDDIRKIDDHLFLGTANFRWQGDYHFILYFALETQ